MKLAFPDYSLPTYSLPNLCLPELWLPEQASNPSPADDATSVVLDTGLSWAAADRASSYNVLFGTSSGSLTTVSSSQTGLSYTITVSLFAFKEYFWRVDSNGLYGTTTGNLWSFTTGNTVTNNYPITGGLAFQTRYDCFTGKNKDASCFFQQRQRDIEHDFNEIAKRINWLVETNFTQHS